MLPQSHPRRHTVYPPPPSPPTPSSTVSSRRSSQTFRSSPLAGPVLSYTNLSALEDDPSDVHHHHQSSSSSSSSLGLSARPAAQRSASTGALGSSDNGHLRPPLPTQHRASRDRVDSSSSKLLSRTSSRSSIHSTATLSSLISLTLSEETEARPTPRTSVPDKTHRPSAAASSPHPYAFRRHSCGPLGLGPHSPRPRVHDIYPNTNRNANKEEPEPEPEPENLSPRPSFVPLNPHSRFSFSPTLSPQSSSSSGSGSSSSSLRSTASYPAPWPVPPPPPPTPPPPRSARVSSRSHGIEIRVEGEGTAEEVLLGDGRSRGREVVEAGKSLAPLRSSSSSSPPPPGVKHDWLAASPTPVFSRSALRTQGVVMPAPARGSVRRRRSGSRRRSRSGEVDGRSGSVRGKRGVAQKERVGVEEMGEMRKPGMSSGSGAGTGAGTGTKKRASLGRLAFQLRSFVSHERSAPAKSTVAITNPKPKSKSKPSTESTEADLHATPPSCKSALQRVGRTPTPTPERGVVRPAPRDGGGYSLLSGISGRVRLSWRTYVRAPPTPTPTPRK